MSAEAAKQILDFWFIDAKDYWWKKDEAFDARIKKEFGDFVEKARNNELEDWKTHPRSCLAYILLIDQFCRNIYRNQPESFSHDEFALGAAKLAIKEAFESSYDPIEKWFLYIPFMHSENLADQEQSLKLYDKLRNQVEPDLKESFDYAYSFAERHHEIIERFGRFPHRNEILGRTSTPEEIEFLKLPGSSF